LSWLLKSEADIRGLQWEGHQWHVLERSKVLLKGGQTGELLEVLGESRGGVWSCRKIKPETINDLNGWHLYPPGHDTADYLKGSPTLSFTLFLKKCQ
jgi:hypothetical protein